MEVFAPDPKPFAKVKSWLSGRVPTELGINRLVVGSIPPLEPILNFEYILRVRSGELRWAPACKSP